MNTEFIKNLDESASGASQKLWKVTPPVRFGYEDPQSETEYVITSAVYVLGRPETYIFPCDKYGNVLDWGELPGSYQGGLSHDEAIAGIDHQEVW